MPPEAIRIKSNDRLFLCGKTGSGKTFAARRITRGLKRLVCIDPGDRLGEWTDLAPWDREARRLLKSGEPIRARVVVDMEKPPEEVWDEVFTAVLNAGNCTVYIDEVYGIIDPGSRPTPALTALWTRGRALGIGGFAATQRPVWVPQFLMSEAEHFFVFRLFLEEDRRRMSSFIGPEVMEPIRDEHGFYYMYAGWDGPLYLPALPVNGRESSTVTVEKGGATNGIRHGGR